MKSSKKFGKLANDILCLKAISLQGRIVTQLYFHKCGFSSPNLIDRYNWEFVGYSFNNFI